MADTVLSRLHLHSGQRKNPDFLAVVIMSAIAMLVIFAVALLFLWISGRHAIPTAHAKPEATSYLSMPAPDLAGPKLVCTQPA